MCCSKMKNLLVFLLGIVVAGCGTPSSDEEKSGRLDARIEDKEIVQNSVNRNKISDLTGEDSEVPDFLTGLKHSEPIEMSPDLFGIEGDAGSFGLRLRWYSDITLFFEDKYNEKNGELVYEVDTDQVWPGLLKGPGGKRYLAAVFPTRRLQQLRLYGRSNEGREENILVKLEDVLPGDAKNIREINFRGHSKAGGLAVPNFGDAEGLTQAHHWITYKLAGKNVEGILSYQLTATFSANDKTTNEN